MFQDMIALGGEGGGETINDLSFIIKQAGQGTSETYTPTKNETVIFTGYIENGGSSQYTSYVYLDEDNVNIETHYNSYTTQESGINVGNTPHACMLKIVHLKAGHTYKIRTVLGYPTYGIVGSLVALES